MNFVKKIFFVLAIISFFVMPKAISLAQTASPLLPAGTLVQATGDITVYKLPNADVPIVHRIIETREVTQEMDYG